MQASDIWPENATVYHVYVRSFQDSDNDGIGDLGGLLHRMDYLQSLGIDTLWLSPIYPSPQVDFGYDISDYKSIDPVFGDLALFDKFHGELEKRGIKLLMDFVPNHTSDQHPWFVESRKSKKNPKRDWYIWEEPKPDGTPPNNWMSVFGGSAWEFDPQTGMYYMHTFDIHQPDLNWHNPQVVDEMLSVLTFWMDKGVDGFRVDAPYWLFHDQSLEDEPTNPGFDPKRSDPYSALLHTKTFAQTETLDMMNRFTAELRKKDRALMVTEVYTDLDELMRMHRTVDWRWYTPFNFSLITIPWKAEEQKKFIDAYDKELGEYFLPNYVLGNHDKSRVVTRIGEKQARIAAMLLFALRGISFLYYGDEIGMKDGKIPPHKIQDPFAKNFPELDFVGRDPQRTPMQWNDTTNAGFSKIDPWLPVNDDFPVINVQMQMADHTSILSLYTMLISLKKTYKALRNGKYSPLPNPADNVLMFFRETNDEKVLIVLNFDSNEKTVAVPFGKARLLCSASMNVQTEEILLDDFQLPGDEGYIIKLLS